MSILFSAMQLVALVVLLLKTTATTSKLETCDYGPKGFIGITITLGKSTLI